MHRALVPLVAGALVILSTVAIDQNQRRLHDSDVRGIANLRHLRDSVKAALAVASSAADSTRLTAEITEREYYLGRREFHVPLRKEANDRRWKATGPGTIGVAVGAAFIILGVVLVRRPASRTS